MQKEWSSFRITLLLYIIVLILPFSFYFVYTSFKTMQHDTKIIRQSSKVVSEINYLSINHPDQKMVKQVDKTLHEISLWVTQNNDSALYIGGQTLSKDFSDVNACWTACKESFSKENETIIKQQTLQCYELTNTLAIIIEKMVYLKQNKIINMFYLSLAIAMILILLIIYMVRTYIHIQMKKNAIYDLETKLFNKNYFLSQLKTSCARSVRYKYPLSMISVSMSDFEKESDRYDKKTQKHIFEMFGGLIIALTRKSDTPCRYDKNNFTILLPDTEGENALILERRIRETLEKHDFMVDSKLNFKFTTTQFDFEETAEAFTTRTQGLS